MASAPSAIARAATTGSAPTDRVSASVHAGVSPAAACGGQICLIQAYARVQGQQQVQI